MNSLRVQHISQFYGLLSKLEYLQGTENRLSNFNGRMDLPQRGVYFFRENGEICGDMEKGLRVVRVGTHALKTGSSSTLWQRLSQHKGSIRSGGGNHRGSIFRLLVGTALIAREGFQILTWGTGNTALGEAREKEQNLERAVSVIIGNMSVLWLAINDVPGPDSQRGYIERNAIALLSNFGKEPVDPPSGHWLGMYCDRELVASSGLWNQRHVDEEYDPSFLDTMAKLVEQMKVVA